MLFYLIVGSAETLVSALFFRGISSQSGHVADCCFGQDIFAIF